MCPSPWLTKDRKKAELCLPWRFGFQAFGFLSSFVIGHSDFNQCSRVRSPHRTLVQETVDMQLPGAKAARNESGWPLALQGSRSGVPPDSANSDTSYTLWQTVRLIPGSLLEKRCRVPWLVRRDA